MRPRLSLPKMCCRFPNTTNMESKQLAAFSLRNQQRFFRSLAITEIIVDVSATKSIFDTPNRIKQTINKKQNNSVNDGVWRRVTYMNQKTYRSNNRRPNLADASLNSRSSVIGEQMATSAAAIGEIPLAIICAA